MTKEKQTYKFVFSTKDLDFDPKTAEVRDTATGKILKLESAIKVVDKNKVKIFAVRMTEGQIERLRSSAKKLNINPPDFGRQALEKAIAEVEDDLQRTNKTKK